MNNILIQTKSLSFKNIVSYDDLSIEKDKVTFITGASGSGKSTLFKLFNGTISPTNGDIYYNDKNILTYDSLSLRRDILLVCQTPYLFDGSIKDNFKKFYHYLDLPTPNLTTIKYFLEICNINYDLNTSCQTMSGGEKQRTYIALFLSFKPKVLLLDEPTSALDYSNSLQCLSNIISFCKANNIALIIISHNLALIEQFSEQTINIERII